jgi:hypothetical protein
MYRHVPIAVAFLAVLAGCEQTSQQLPFEGDTALPITRQIPAAGGTVNSGAGASVAFPAGALGPGASVTVTPRTAAAPLGTSAAAYSFRIDPAGIHLASPAQVELKLRGDDQSSWLASLVLDVNGELIAIGDASVDLALGTVRGEIPALGDVSAVIPPAHAVAFPTVLRQSGVSASAPAAGTSGSEIRSLFHDCDTRSACDRPIQIEASSNLLSLTDRLAVLFPVTHVAMDFAAGVQPGQPGTHSLSGAGAFTGSVRVGLGRSASTTRVQVALATDAMSSATISESAITLHGLLVRVHQRVGDSWSAVDERRETLTVARSGRNELSVELRGLSINGEAAVLRVYIPVEIAS